MILQASKKTRTTQLFLWSSLYHIVVPTPTAVFKMNDAFNIGKCYAINIETGLLANYEVVTVSSPKYSY